MSTEYESNMVMIVVAVIVGAAIAINLYDKWRRRR